MLRNRWIILAVMVLSGAGILYFGRQQKPQQNESTGTTEPQRIITMAPNLTEIVFALGLGEKVVGVSTFCNYPEEAKSKPKMGNLYPDIEAVVAARPDLLITYDMPSHQTLARQLESRGCRTLMLTVETVSDIYHAIDQIAQATNHQNQGQALKSHIQTELAALNAKLTTANPLKVLWVVQTQPLLVAGQDTYITEILALAGAENAIGPTLPKYPAISAEQVVVTAPDVIIEPEMPGVETQQQQLDADQRWQRFAQVPAVKNGRVYVIDTSMITIPGPRLPQVVQRVARVLWPDRFTEMSHE